MLIKPSSGRVLFENSEIVKFERKDLLDFRRSKISMVFQNFGLMGHRDILGNVAYGLGVKGVPRVERERTAAKMIKMVVFITHDINEAFKLGDTVAIMRDGKLIQVDTPEGMSAHPADDYVQQFIDGADKTKILSVRSVMVTPCVVRIQDSPQQAIREMRGHGVSTAYVVEKRMRLRGIVNINDAIHARGGNLPLSEICIEDVQSTSIDTMVGDVIPLAAEAKYPIAVLDGDGSLQGIITKASVLSSMI